MTIWQYLTYLQELAKSVNSKYVNVGMDMGAAIKAYNMIWNFQKNLETLLSTLVISIWWKKTFMYIREMHLSDISCENCLRFDNVST